MSQTPKAPDAPQPHADPVGAAIAELRAALGARRGGVRPYDEDHIADHEESLGRAFPAPWRRVLAACGGPRELPWPREGLTLSAADAVEHQTETDDGQAITERGRVVIGYIEGSGDCLTMDEGGDDPTVYAHSHSDGEDEPIGTLSSFLRGLAQRL